MFQNNNSERESCLQVRLETQEDRISGQDRLTEIHVNKETKKLYRLNVCLHTVILSKYVYVF